MFRAAVTLFRGARDYANPSGLIRENEDEFGRAAARGEFCRTEDTWYRPNYKRVGEGEEELGSRTAMYDVGFTFNQIRLIKSQV